jgi:pyruvate dehydrogenase E1 component beta subunit
LLGISVEVINLRTLRPLDHKTVIESVKKTSRMVTVEEGWPQCGERGREGGREGGRERS